MVTPIFLKEKNKKNMATNATILPSRIKYTDDKNIKHELFLKPRQANITNNNELIDLYRVDEIIYIDNNSLKISTIGDLSKKYELYIDDLDTVKELLKHDIYRSALENIHHVIDINLSDKIINKILENSDHSDQLLNNIYKIHIPPSSTIIQRYYNNFIYDIRDTLIYLKINLKETPSIKNYLYKEIYNANQSNPILNELNEYYSEANTYKKISNTTIYEIRKYDYIEIIKILIDIDINISKHNIKQFETAFVNMCEDMKNTNGHPKYFSIYIVAKIDIAKIYTEQHKKYKGIQKNNIDIDRPYLYLGDTHPNRLYGGVSDQPLEQNIVLSRKNLKIDSEDEGIAGFAKEKSNIKLI